MGTLTSRLADIKKALEDACRDAGRSKSEVTLVAVSKRQPDALVEEAYACGVRDFGENTLQGFEARRAWAKTQGIDDIRWHFIGQIQSRKAKSVWGEVTLVHTLDRIKLLKTVGAERAKTQAVLVQVNVGEEPQKGGVLPGDLPEMLDSCGSLGACPRGLMCIPPNDGRPEFWFQRLRQLAQTMTEAGHLPANPELSMGMSSDFVTAVGYGATLVRVGSSLFGERKEP